MKYLTSCHYASCLEKIIFCQIRHHKNVAWGKKTHHNWSRLQILASDIYTVRIAAQKNTSSGGHLYAEFWHGVHMQNYCVAPSVAPFSDEVALLNIWYMKLWNSFWTVLFLILVCEMVLFLIHWQYTLQFQINFLFSKVYLEAILRKRRITIIFLFYQSTIYPVIHVCSEILAILPSLCLYLRICCPSLLGSTLPVLLFHNGVGSICPLLLWSDWLSHHLTQVTFISGRREVSE